MRISATIRGFEKIAKRLQAISPEAVKATVVGLNSAAIAIHREAVSSIQEHRSQGKRYGKHVASKPGYPPNTDTGLLVKSIQIVEASETKLVAAVGTNLEYGARLENGDSRVAPRPWLGPAYLKTKPQIMGLFKLKKAGGGNG